MDNASKALIMAGAILISLALVGLGVYIFSISSDLQGNAGQQMDVMAAQTTNKQLSNYAGTKVRGSNVKALYSLVDTLNIQEVFPVPIRYRGAQDEKGTAIAWKGAPSTGEVIEGGSGDSTAIRDSAYYEVIIQDELASDGYLDTIHIKAYAN